MADFKSSNVGYHKQFLPLQPSTKLPKPLTRKYSSNTPQTLLHDSLFKGPSLPKTNRQGVEMLLGMSPFFRHSVTVQLLGDKSLTGQQYFKVVRDLDGELISTGNTRNSSQRFEPEQTTSFNRTNLTRKIFPEIKRQRLGFSYEESANSSRNMKKMIRQSVHDASVITHLRNFSVPSNSDYYANDFISGDHKERGHQMGTFYERHKAVIKNSDRIFIKSSRAVEILDCDNKSASSPCGRSLESPFFARDHRISCSRVLLSRGQTNQSTSPDSIFPEVIKIIPQRKEPTARSHVTKMESKRRLESSHVFAPPPSPVMTKYSYFSETGTFVEPKKLN